MKWALQRPGTGESYILLSIARPRRAETCNQAGMASTTPVAGEAVSERQFRRAQRRDRYRKLPPHHIKKYEESGTLNHIASLASAHIWRRQTG